MFCRRHHVRPIYGARPLKAEDGGEADARDQVGILAVCFFCAAPTRVARQIEHRRKAMLRAPGAYFGRGRGKNTLYERGVPGGGQGNGLGIRSAAGRDMSMQALIVKENGDSQARVFLHPLLHCIGVDRHLARPALLARARDFAQAVFEKDRGIFWNEVSILRQRKASWDH